jgi:hypothetical protein
VFDIEDARGKSSDIRILGECAIPEHGRVQSRAIMRNHVARRVAGPAYLTCHARFR